MSDQLQTHDRLWRSQDSQSLTDPTRIEDAARIARATPPQESALVEIWKLMWSCKLWILGLAALGTAAGLIATLVQPSLYQARALLEIQNLNENFLNMQEVAATVSGAGSQARSDLQTQVKVLGSRSVIEAAEKTLLRQAPLSYTESTESRWLPWRVARTPKSIQHSAIRTASESVRVRSSDGSRMVEVLCDSTDPRIAAGFANAVVEEFIAGGLRSRWQAAQQTEQWLNRQLGAAQSTLEGAEGKLRDYVQRRDLFFTPQQQDIEQEKLRQFQQALSRAQEERVTRQSRHELAGSRDAQGVPEVLDDSVLQQYQGKLIDLRREYARLSSLYTDEHNGVKQVLAQIKALEPVVEQQRANRIVRIHNEFDAALRRESLLAEDYRRQRELVLRQADVAVEFGFLDREVETARQIYETLLRKVKEAGIATAMNVNQVQVIDHAMPPEAPYRPNIPAGTAMGLVSGAFLGALLVFLREQTDERLKRPGDAVFHVGVAELGLVYESGRLAGAGLYRGSSLILRIAWRRDPTTRVAPKLPNPDRSRAELGAWQRRSSRWIECFRAARTSILFHEGFAGRLKSLVVTSPRPAEGKSTVACHLAIAMAETGRRTLLIDADLRKPRLHEVFGLPNGRGLSDLLHPGEPLARALTASVFRETEIAGLTLLPSGAVNGGGATLLHSERTEELIRRLEREFDFVIVDSPPLLPVPDARVLARFCGAAVVVLRLNETVRRDAVIAARQLQADGTRLLGAILNGWSPRVGGDNYASGYAYASSPTTARPAEKTLAASA